MAGAPEAASPAAQPAAAASAAVAASQQRPDYTAPEWAGAPSTSGFAVELIVRGEVRERIPLDTEAHTSFCIGRAKNCDVVLERLMPRASRFHCILQCKKGASEMYVYDLGSSHGTSLNGRRLDPRSFEPLRVGEQLRFDADRPRPTDCIAVLCGPEDAMQEEGEVDLTAFREQAARERAERERKEQEDLARRKDAKKKRMAIESQRQAVVGALAARAQLKMQAQQEAEQQDREKLHQVTWGMADDATELPDADQSEDVQRLMDESGRLDGEKVRKLSLTDKQEQMLKRLEEKQKKLTNLQKEKARLEGGGAKSRGKGKKGGDEWDTEFDVAEDSGRGGGGINLEKAAQLEDKLEKVEGEINMQTDNLLLSLGLRKAGGVSDRPSKRRAALYDTHNEDEEDDFFDRTTTNKERKGGGGASAAADDENDATELKGLPTLDKVENQASLETKVGLLGAEKARITVQLAAEMAKERQRNAAAAAGGGDEDSLEAFMSGTLNELRSDRRSKLQRRMEAVESRLAEADKLLRVARRNAGESKPAPAPAVAGGAATAAAAAAAAIAAATASAVRSGSAPASGSKPPAQADEGSSGAPARAQGARSRGAGAGGGGLAEALARLQEQGACDPSPPAGAADPDAEKAANAANAREGAAANADADVGAAAAAGAKARRGPERPPAQVLQAAAASVSAPSSASKGAPASVTTEQAVESAAAMMAAAMKRRTPNATHIDVSKGGVQMMAPASRKRPAPDADEASMPPPSALKKVYGAMRPPAAGRRPAASRDEGVDASGEAEEPEG